MRVQSHGPRTNANQPFLTLRAEVKNSRTTGIFADILLDLQNIVKFTLLSFELSFETSKSDIQTFVFPESQRELFYKENKAKPIYNSQEQGIVVVLITVNQSGEVINAISGAKGSTTLNKNLLKRAKEAALQTRFNEKKSAPKNQQGKIIYYFSLN